MDMGRRALIAAWLVVNFFIVFSLALYESGYTIKGYFPAYGKSAREYAPVVYTPPRDAPQKALYDLGKGGGIVYYYIWPTESMGKPLIDRLYDYIRKLFYGSEADIEPITVYPENRTVTFESYGHEKIVATFDEHDCHIENETIRNCVLNGTHVKVYVVTWNHAFSLHPLNGTAPAEIELEPMSPWEYAHYAIFRRANESIKEAALRAALVAVVLTVAINVSGYYLLTRRGGWAGIRKRLRKGS